MRKLEYPRRYRNTILQVFLKGQLVWLGGLIFLFLCHLTYQSTLYFFSGVSILKQAGQCDVTLAKMVDNSHTGGMG